MRRLPISTWLASFLFIRAALIVIFLRVGWEFFSADDAARFQQAENWVAHPYWFTAWDGIWLTGGTIYFGLWIKFLGAAVGMAVGCLVAASAAILAAYFAAWEIGRNRLGALLAAGAVTGLGGSLWFSLGPLSENLQGAAFLFCLGAGVRYLRRPTWAMAVLCGLAAFVAASLHYVCWMMLAVLVPVLCVGHWRACRRRDEPLLQHGWQLVVIAAGAAAFPLLWMVGSWHYLGHPLQFLVNQRQLMERYMGLLGRQSEWLPNLLIYPRELVRMVWPALLALLPLPWVLWRREKGSGALGLGLALLFLCLMLMMGSALGGGYGVPERSLILLALLVLLLAGVTLGSYASAGRGWRRLVMLGVAVVYLLQQYTLTLDFAQRFFSPTKPDLIALGHWLRHELAAPQTLRGWTATSGVQVTLAKLHPDLVCSVFFLSNCPARISLVSSDGRPPALAPGDVWITDQDTTSTSYTQVRSFGSLHVLQAPAAP